MSNKRAACIFPACPYNGCICDGANLGDRAGFEAWVKTQRQPSKEPAMSDKPEALRLAELIDEPYPLHSQMPMAARSKT